MKQRPSANTTRQAIIKAARQCFVAKGYAGTSMNDIAHAANVTKSLLFHHFTNKELLWQLAKQDILNEESVAVSELSNNENLETCIRHIVDNRLTLYQQNPDLVRLIQWQHLAQEKIELAELNRSQSSPSMWRSILTRLQNKGEIRQDMTIDSIILLIASVSASPFTMDYFSLTQSADKLSAIKEQFIDCLVKALKPQA